MSQVRLIILVVFVINTVTSVAQSDNYWSWNFNTPSTLMAGSVIAGNAGPSAVYYNPALIDQEDMPNFSIGFKQYVSPHLIVYGGFRTDFTASVTDDEGFVSNGFSISRVQLDKYHFSLGPVWEYKRFKVLTGLQYTHGSNNDMFQMVNYSDPVEYDPETDQSLEGIRQNNVEARLNEIALFFGLTVDLN